MSLDNLQRALLIFALIVAALLLIKFAVDFTAEMPVALAVPFWALVAASLAVVYSNVASRASAGEPRQMSNVSKSRVSKSGVSKSRISKSGVSRGLLLAMIPLGFLASSLDCSGLTLMGCSPYCGFIKTIWISALAAISVAYFFSDSGLLLSLILLMSFAPLFPHCVCFNIGNGWWIERVGASPVCYAWGFAASLIAVSALIASRKVWPSLITGYGIIGGATVFFVSHHYFHFPW
jgi:hypothetical protein